MSRTKNDQGSVSGAEGDALSNADLVALDIDVLAPAALESVITADNADEISAGVIVEIANGPVASDADRILIDNGVVVLPDGLANAGGVTVSYFEWVQNRQVWSRDADTVGERLQSRMVDATQAVADRADESDVDLRTAVYMRALETIESATAATGTSEFFARQ